MSTTRAQPEEKALRADAQRNLELVLKAAGEAFAEQGLDVGVADIAKRAGVGTGTIFRRFPTKDDLIAAVFQQRVAEILGAAREGAAMDDPEEGLRHFFEVMIAVQLRDRGCLEAAGSSIWGEPRIMELRDELLSTLDGLLDGAKAAGVVREEIAPADLPVLVNAVAHGASILEPARPGIWRRYARIALDGLRPQSRKLEPGPPTVGQVKRALQLESERRR
jgi:AcrR family transcriptional regulator